MRKILIADASRSFCEAVAKCLETEYDIICCHDGQTVIAYVNEYTPDMLVIDLSLPHIDGLNVLNMLRCAGKNLPVLALAANASDCVMQILSCLKVSHICQKPCSLEALICSIRMVAQNADSSLWIPETEVDNLLLQLGFRMGLTRYDNVRTAILLKYYGRVDSMTKSLYPMIAERNGGNAAQVEKSIRDAIHHAFRTGNGTNWNLYFFGTIDSACPSNEMFVARMASALRNRSRVQEEELLCLKVENG